MSLTVFLYNKILEEEEDCRTKRFLAPRKSEGIAEGVIRENLARKKARHSRFDFRICNWGTPWLRRRWWGCSRLRGVATLRRCDAATPISSRLRDFATLRRCHAAGGAARVFAVSTLRRCRGLLASSRLHVFGMKSWNPPCALNVYIHVPTINCI